MKKMEGIFEVKIQGMDPMKDKEIKERIAKAIAKEIAEYKTSVEYDSHNMTMMTDFYEMTMSNGYFLDADKDVRVAFDVFYRKNPDEGGFAVFAGVFEMVARTLVGLVFVPIFGFTAACSANPLAWILADCFLIPAFFHCRKKLQNAMTR